MEVSHPTVVGVVSRMEQNGYLTSWMDGNDRRNKNVRLTAQAEAVGAEMEQRINENEKMLVSPLSDEDADRLKEMLLLIYENLDKH